MTDDVFDANLRSLLSRCYAAIEPTVAFRTALVARVGRLAPRRGAPVPSYLAPLAAAAAILCAVTIGWIAKSPEASSYEGLLARGEIAVRDGLDRPWRSSHEGPRGHEPIAIAGPLLELRTPGALAALPELVVDGGVLAAEADSHLRIWRAAESAPDEGRGERGSPVVDLLAGGLRMSRSSTSIPPTPGAREPWSLLSPEGRIDLEEGTLEARLLRSPAGEQRLHVRLVEGTAWLLGETGIRALAVGVPLRVRAGELASDDLASVGVEPVREPVGSTPEPSEDEPAEPSPPRGISGRVFLASREPASSLVVGLLRQEQLPSVSVPRMRTFLVEDGRFAWEDLDPGTYRAFVVVDGHAVYCHSDVQITEDRGARLADTHLVLGGTVRGRVVDAAGLPVSGAIVLSETDMPVQVLPTAPLDDMQLPATAATDRDGFFELTHLSPNDHVLRASQPGFGPVWTRLFAVPDGGEVEGLLFHMAAGGTVQGAVYRSDGTPWANTQMIASRIDPSGGTPCMTYGGAVTDVDGRFEVSDLASGLYAILNAGVESEDGRPLYPNVIPLKVEAGAVSEIRIPVDAEGASLSGVVVDTAGDPVSNHTVFIDPVRQAPGSDFEGWQTTNTDEQGRYEFQGVTPGTYDFFIGRSVMRGFTRQARIEVRPFSRETRDIRVFSPQLEGVARNGTTGNVLPGIVVVAERHDGGEIQFAGKVIADSSGAFVFPFLEPGRYRVRGHPAGGGGLAMKVVRDVWISRDAPTEPLELVFQVGGELNVRVRDAAGRPVPGAEVQLDDGSGEMDRSAWFPVTDEEGLFRVGFLEPGRWWVVVDHEDFPEVALPVQIRAGERIELPVTVEAPR